ncbi:MAG: rRNA maturation RNase YbeY [Phycisphaeraceae bacterium]
MSAREGDRALTVEVTLADDEADPALAAWIESRVSHVAESLGVRRGQLSVVLLSDRDMADAHRRHLDVEGPTDTLSFDLRDPAESEDPTVVEGEVLLGLGVARRQAESRGHEVRLELLLYALHGLLHLLGEDDQTDAGFRRMHHKENQLLRALGLPPIADTDPSR